MYGGALYIFMVFGFIFLLSLPVLLCEYAVGRGSKKSLSMHYQVLQPKGTKWHWAGYFCFPGQYILLMFFAVVCGIALHYVRMGFTGQLIGASPAEVAGAFTAITGSAGALYGATVFVILLGMFFCYLGLNKGVERVAKYMMGAFFAIILVLLVRGLTLPGAYQGLAFLFIPNLDAMREHGTFRIIHMALGQSLFSLSVGIGGMAVFGSYFPKDKRLFREATTVAIVDTSVIMLCLLMIFPAAFAFGISPGIGEGLLFVTLPNLFNAMPASYVWALLFYLGLFFVAFSTVVGILEAVVGMSMDKFGWTRRKAALVNAAILVVLMMPGSFGRNIWIETLGFVRAMGFPHFGPFLTFLLMEIVLPIGALMYIRFCTSKRGWTWDNFFKEVNTGTEGWLLPAGVRFWMTYVLPTVIIFLFIFGQVQRWILSPMGIVI
jgi:NSS family neurotransmitter:Na+ symporter